MAAKVYLGTDAGNEGQWNVAANWSPSGVPADGDSVRFTKDATQALLTYEGTAGEIDATASGTIAFIGFYVDAGCTVNIGAAASWLKMNLASGTDNEIFLNGSGTAYLNAAGTKLVSVGGAGTIYFVGDTTTANVLNVVGDSATVYVGKTDATSVEFDTVNVTANADVTLYEGLTAIDGAAAPAVNLDAGDIISYCALGTVKQNSGNLYHKEGTLTTLTLATGTCQYDSTGTMTTATVLGEAHLDFSNDARAKTVTNAIAYKGADITDPLGVVTWTNGIDLYQCMPSECTIQVARHKTWTPSAI